MWSKEKVILESRLANNLIYKIELDVNEIKSFIDLMYLFQIIDSNDRMILCIKEERNNVALEYNYKNIDFSEEKLKKAINEKLNF